MMAFWLRLSERDRRMLAMGGLLVAAMLLWAWVWDPLSASRASLREQASANETSLAWMRPAVEQVLSRGGIAAPVSDGRSLLARIDASARAAGLGAHLTLIEPQGEQRVRLQFSAVDFDALVGWLEAQSREGVRIEEWNASRAAGSGRVDARLALAGNPR